MFPCVFLLVVSLAMALAPACLPVPELRWHTSFVNCPLSSPARTTDVPSSSKLDVQRQLREVSDAAARTTEWILSHTARANDIDKSLDPLRALGCLAVSYGLLSVNEEQRVRLTPAKDRRISGLPLPPAVFSKPHSQRE